MKPSLDHPVRLLASASAVGLAFVWAFYNKPIGLSVMLFVALLLLVLWLSGRAEQIRPRRANLWLVPPLLFFAVFAGVRANGFLTFLNLLAVVGLLALLAASYTGDALGTRSLPAIFGSSALAMVHSLFAGVPVARAAAVEWRGRPSPLAALLALLRGLLLAVPVLLLFGALLVSADLVFADRVERLLEQTDLIALLRQLWLTLAVAWVVLGGLVHALTRHLNRLTAEQAAKLGIAAPPTGGRLGLPEGLVALNAVNLLFAAFVWVQFTYLFGGRRALDDLGVTYAEYARRGFFELLAVAALTLLLVLSLRAHLARHTLRATRLFNLSATITVALVVVLLISAFRRLRLYELTFGFTEQRLYGYVAMVWLAVVFGWFLLALWLRPQRLAVGLFVCMLGFVVALNVINPDVLIVRANWQRYLLLRDSLGAASIRAVSPAPGDFYRGVPEASALDLLYLMSLSNDAVPALLEILPQLDGIPHMVLRNELRARGHMLLYEAEIRRPPLQATHIGHWRAARAISTTLGMAAVRSYRPAVDDIAGRHVGRPGLFYDLSYPTDVPVVWPAALPSGAR